MKQYAVCFTYSFDNDASVYLFDTYEEAIKFLKDAFENELRIDTEENEWDSVGEITEDSLYAKITTRFRDHENITEFHCANVYE